LVHQCFASYTKLNELRTILDEIKGILLEVKNKPVPLNDWVPEQDAQKLLGRKETSLWALRKKKKFISSKIGSKVFTVKNQLKNY
jgi:hypothetical protein